MGLIVAIICAGFGTLAYLRALQSIKETRGGEESKVEWILILPVAIISGFLWVLPIGIILALLVLVLVMQLLNKEGEKRVDSNNLFSFVILAQYFLKNFGFRLDHGKELWPVIPVLLLEIAILTIGLIRRLILEEAIKEETVKKALPVIVLCAVLVYMILI